MHQDIQVRKLAKRDVAVGGRRHGGAFERDGADACAPEGVEQTNQLRGEEAAPAGVGGDVVLSSRETRREDRPSTWLSVSDGPAGPRRARWPGRKNARSRMRRGGRPL